MSGPPVGPRREPPAPIVALDVGELGAALALVDRLGDACRFYKIGSELFTAAGPDAVRAVVARGADVFLDLKFHDIPNTVAGAVRSAAGLGVRLLTVHGSGGGRMLDAAVESARLAGGHCGVLAVTALTSMTEAELAAAWGRSELRIANEVLRLAAAAATAGAHGVVCSGHEASAVRDHFADRLAVLVPGVRPTGHGAHDQARVATPAQAANVGARYIVLGRVVTTAQNPAAALHALVAQLG